MLTSDLDNLFEMERELIPVAANWRSIGIALRLKPNNLQTIDTNCSGNPRDCLSSMLIEFLKRNYNVGRFGEPTWQRLVEIVGHPAGGGNMELARNIARRHKAEGMSSGLTIPIWKHNFISLLLCFKRLSTSLLIYLYMLDKI